MLTFTVALPSTMPVAYKDVPVAAPIEGVVNAALVMAVPLVRVDGKSPAATALNAGDVAVANSAWVVVVSAAVAAGAAPAPPPYRTPYWVSSAVDDWLVVVSYQGMPPAVPAVFDTSIVLVAVNVLPSTMVNVLPVAGTVTDTLLSLTAVVLDA